MHRSHGVARDVIATEPPHTPLAVVKDEPPGARPVALMRPKPPRASRDRVKIPFVAANRCGEQLALDVEYRAIEDSIRAARYRDAFQLIPKLAARPSDLQQALLEHRPDVVHLDGLTITPEGRVRASAEKASWPAVCVTWYGASEYCRAHGKRLPLETEWELAAKGSSGRPFPWSVDLPGVDGVTFDLRNAVAAHPGDVGNSPQDVSPEGIRDLGGSVAEWVQDDRDLEHEKTIRGGSWASSGPCHLLGSGKKHVPAERFGKDLGFRCARSVLDASAAGNEAR